MPTAVIVAHGQPSDPDPAEASLARLATRIDQLTDRVTVRSATLAAPGALEKVLDDIPDGSAIYPLFMAKGWFVTSALPKRLEGRAVRQLDPLGVDPQLPNLVAHALQPLIDEQGWSTTSTDLLIAAHGSGRSRNPAAVTHEFADRLAGLISLKSIRCGFVEEAPSISDAAKMTGDHAICLPFFACTGGHVLDDIPAELGKAAFRGPVLPVVGELDEIQSHVARTLDGAFAD
ncbi:CbiX/SirB N-terminal domain-containing protein [Ruegeria arenilitoris]|uniref:CbiX/SirB N-terminal domain-containing protein n=1 Tax=Ruegeria arenilitoris TaxID=1173585 RepID=UPI0014810136|nr:CbiX/SirB N-terminal domain-containing protein [Ruegeria arenilitoris]